MGESSPLTSLQSRSLENSRVKNDESELDCSEYKNDLDVLHQFPFDLEVRKENELFDTSGYIVHENDTHFVKEVHILDEEMVPSSVYCLSKLRVLQIERTPFRGDVIPDSLRKLNELRELIIYDSTLIKITEELGKMSNITMMIFSNCSLSSLPDLSNLENVWNIDLGKNYFSEMKNIPRLSWLTLQNNHFTEIPIIKHIDALEYLSLDQNSLKSLAPLTKYRNLKGLFLNSVNLTSIPSDIDKLQQLEHLDLTHNQLTYLPMNILNLPRLEDVWLEGNLFTSDQIQSIQKSFAKHRPNTTLTF